MPMSAAEVERAILSALPGATVEIIDLAGDGDHYSAVVTAPQFAGLNRVAQQRLVYNALGGRMGGALHALKLTTRPA
ncbi:MAG: BolA family transcriptional regulator [Sandarakinorhabdus sp.]|jgi:stress-induced morphogen|nr:BolA family transcriptional regulator [Sandarakinorhabdus sp.]